MSEEYYLMAIDKGDIDAMNNLGILYENEQKYEFAEKYYLMAIEKGHCNAMTNLGLMYWGGEKMEHKLKQYVDRLGWGIVIAAIVAYLVYRFIW